MVDVELRPAETVQRAQLVLDGRGAFEVMGPVPRPVGISSWSARSPASWSGVIGAMDRDQEVAVTLHVGVADSEGVLQVGADEVVAQDRGGAFVQIAEQLVELGNCVGLGLWRRQGSVVL
jgi:hypothetical protein